MKTIFSLIGILIIFQFIQACTKKNEVPTLTTYEVTNISGISALSGGSVTNEGSGLVLVKGICWNINGNPTIEDNKTQDGDGVGTFVSHMYGLNLSTTYFVRAYARSKAGTAYGNQLSFNTGAFVFNPELTYGTVSDIDGNKYNTIQIGNQEWMAENLRTTKYNTGLELVNDTGWHYDAISGYCWVQNDESRFKSVYGALYRYSVLSSGDLCPEGWHVPSKSELNVLINNYGGEILAGSSLKETTTLHWLDPNSSSTNISGFTAVPSGYRTSIPSGFPYAFFGTGACVGYLSNDGWAFLIYSDPMGNTFLPIEYWDKPGFSVRCLKDI